MTTFCIVAAAIILFLLFVCMIVNWAYTAYFKIKCRKVQNCQKETCAYRKRCKKTAFTGKEIAYYQYLINSIPIDGSEKEKKRELAKITDFSAF